MHCLVSVAVYIKKVMSLCIDVIVVDGVRIMFYTSACYATTKSITKAKLELYFTRQK